MRLDPTAAFASSLARGAKGWPARLLFAVIALAGMMTMAGCTPHIGDHCTLSTDCSLQGDRQCDTAEPNGYCTVFGCQGNLCPDQAACVLFYPAVQGCGYNDREPSRTAHAACMKQCSQNSDCRTDEGYVCADPKALPWSALILDDDQSQHICIPDPHVAADTTPGDASVPQVCSANSPDAGEILSSQEDSGTDASLMTPVDAGFDAGDASDAGDAGDGG
ncbi:MAG: hypothetical protein ABI461_09760 [Polyangiaceae bacterium]